MKLSKTRQAIVEEFENEFGEVAQSTSNLDLYDYFDSGIHEQIKDYLTQALNDYTESIVRMVRGMEPKCPITSSEKWAYDQALNDINEELTNDTK